MKKKTSLLMIATFFMVAVAQTVGNQAFSAERGGHTMRITSAAFTEGQMIPAKYTCDGQDISPPLDWRDAPVGTRSFALICDDPDAPMGTWVHWVVYNIPAQTTKFEENLKREGKLNDKTRQGNNSWPKIGYGGPCPPSGTHRYYFKLYALDTVLDINPGATKEMLLAAMKGHILAEASLMGKYQRQR